MGKTSFYRVEVGGGHTGSSEFYECLVTGLVEEASSFMAGFVGDEQSAAMSILEGFRGVIEVIDDGTVTHRTTFWPAVRVKFGDTSFRHDGDLWHMDDIALTGETMDEHSEKLDEIFFEPSEVSVSWEDLRLPDLAHASIAAGTTVTVTNLKGQTYSQKAGDVAGHMAEGDAPSSYDFRAFKMPA